MLIWCVVNSVAPRIMLCTIDSDTTFKISIFCLYCGLLGYNISVMTYKVSVCMVIWCNNPEEHSPNFLNSENFKSQVSSSVSELLPLVFIILPYLLYDF